MPVSISGTNGVTFPDSSLQAAAASPYVLKNRLINSDMRIDQRNAGASVTPTTDLVYNTVDRWQPRLSASSKYSLQQNAGSVTPPTGFTNYLGVTSLAATSVAATDYYAIEQKIEGFNTADLSFGTANSQTITLSFWVRSSLTGTFGGNIRNATSNYCYPFSYTISSANTWEKKSLTITGATAGTWLSTNGVGMNVAFNLGVGSTYTGTANTWYASTILNPTSATSVVGTNGATFYITGVQLEQNTSATPFERRLYNQELANCQRYYIKITDPGASGVAAGSDSTRHSFFLPVTMRAAPTVLASGTFNFYNGGATSTGTALAYYPGISAQIVQIDFSLVSGFTTGQASTLYTNGGSNFVSASAEL